MSFMCSYMLEVEGSMMRTMGGCLEDMIRLPRVNDLEFPSSSMSVACVDSSLENQKE